jgi:hypothetical protein
MTPSRKQPGVSFWTTVAVGAALFMTASRAQTANREPPELQSLREQRLTKMRSFVEALTIAEVDGASERPIKLVSEPVLRFSDPDRLHSDGTLWVWGDRGRPRAFSEVFLKDDSEKVLYHGVTSTADGPLVGRKKQRTIWSPRRAGIDFAVLPDAPQPLPSSRDRRVQMKRLAKRFTAYEVFPEDRRSELRLLTSPVHQYEDQEAGILDGGAFVLALGTNPELILLLEARGADGADARWNYAVARRGNAPLFVEIDGKPVWEAPVYFEGTAKDIYFYSISPID